MVISAIIKARAIKHRFDIESRISSSGFEIIKERQIAFHEEDEGVFELFGHEVAPSLCGYVCSCQWEMSQAPISPPPLSPLPSTVKPYGSMYSNADVQ